MQEVSASELELLGQVEKGALAASRNLEAKVRQLQEALSALSSLNVQYVRAYSLAVDNITATSASSVASLYSLMEKTKSLVSELHAMSEVADQVKELKKSVEVLESQVTKVLK